MGVKERRGPVEGTKDWIIMQNAMQSLVLPDMMISDHEMRS